MSTQDKSRISSIEKLPQILDLFINNPSLSLHQIHLYTGMSKTTISRMCNSLVAIGYLEKYYIGQTPYYRLGTALYRLGIHAIDTLDIQERAKKYLHSLSKELGDNSYLFIQRNKRALCLDSVKGNFYIETNTTRIGDLLPFNKGGGPLAILSNFDIYTQNESIKDLNLSSEEEVILRQKIEVFRKQGFTISLEEFAPGTGAIGVPIFGVTKEVIGALSIGGILSRFSEERIIKVEKVLKMSALELSKEMGFLEDTIVSEE